MSQKKKTSGTVSSKTVGEIIVQGERGGSVGYVEERKIGHTQRVGGGGG